MSHLAHLYVISRICAVDVMHLTRRHPDDRCQRWYTQDILISVSLLYPGRLFAWDMIDYMCIQIAVSLRLHGTPGENLPDHYSKYICCPHNYNPKSAPPLPCFVSMLSTMIPHVFDIGQTMWVSYTTKIPSTPMMGQKSRIME